MPKVRKAKRNRNPVAKFAHEFNKSTVQLSKKKRQKHKKPKHKGKHHE